MRSVPSRVAAAVALAIIAALSATGSAQAPADVRPAGEPVAHAITGGVSEHRVARGETLRQIGSRYGVDPAAIAAGNGIAVTAVLKAGQALRIDNRHIVPAFREPGEIVINVPQRMVFFAGADGPRAFPAAVGRRNWRTPIGEFSIVTKETDPTWDVPASIRAEAERAGRTLPEKVPPGPSNPLGKYWVGLSLDGLGIHGTNAPSSVYQTVTHGCIRLGPDDIETLQALLSVGMRGRIVYEPILLAVVGNVVYVESHPDAYGRITGSAESRLRALADAAGVAARIDWREAERVLSAREGVARAVTLEGGGEVSAVSSTGVNGSPAAFDWRRTAARIGPGAPPGGCRQG